MTQHELAARVAITLGMAQPVVEQVIRASLDTIRQALVEGEDVSLYRFGRFEVVRRAAKVGRNINTNEEVPVPARNVPSFKPSDAFKQAVNSEQES